MPSLTGIFECLNSIKYDEYLESVGYEYFYRSVYANANPVTQITNEGDEWTIKTYYGFTRTETRFRLGVEFEKFSVDERLCRCLFTQEGDDKLVFVKKFVAGNLTTRIVSEFGENAMKMTCEGPGPGPVATRIFQKIYVVPIDYL